MKEKPLHLKRAVFAVLFTLLLSVAGVTNATAQSFTVGDLTYSFNDDGASVTLTGHVDGISGQLVIPESVELYGTSYPVTAIGNYAFSECYDLTGDLVIPNSVITIGESAFQYCTGLTGSLTIGDAVQTIGYGAFYECYNMTGSLTLGSSVQTIQNYAFDFCNFTGTLTIPESMTYIGNSAFYDCDFAKLNYNATNCEVDYYWLWYCDQLSTLTIGENVQAIPNGFLYQRSSFTGGLVIPNSVTSIGSNAFEGCTGFPGALNIPNSVTTIGQRAFYGCNGFNSLNIGNSVTSIGENAFYGCSGFTGSLNIPNSVTTISNSAFYGCSGFTSSLTIGNAVTTIGENAFNGCSGFTGSLTIPNSVTTIGSSAFLNCSGFSGTLTLGNSLTQIGNSAFFGACEYITSFEVWAETPPALGNYVFLSANTGIPVYVPCSTLEAYQNASGWSNFTNFQEFNPCQWSIGATVYHSTGGTVNGAGIYEQGQTCTLTATPFSGFVFSRWTEDGEVVSTDATYSFVVEGNRNLVAYFTSPDFIVFADPNVEARCIELWDSNGDGYLSYDEAAVVTNLNYAFQYNDEITSFEELQYFTGLTFLNSYEFYSCDNLTSIILPEGINSIANDAFRNCYALSSVTLPNSINSIGNSAFQECNALTSVTLPDNINSIGSYAFYSCDALTSVTLPESLTTISYSTFYCCYSLASVVIPESVTYIDGWAFAECYSLNSITLQSITPPEVSGDCPFCYIDMNNIVVTVPCNTTETYRNAYIWNEFNNYQEPNTCFYEITATLNYDDAGTVSGAGSYQSGATCTVTATPNTGYSFLYWEENGETVSTEAEYTFIVNANRNLVAHIYNPIEMVVATYYPDFGNPESPYVMVSWGNDNACWHTYCESEFDNAYRSNSGYNPSWGYEYPISMMAQYAGAQLTKVAVFSDNIWGAVGGNFTCSIYIGGTTPEAGTLASTIIVDVPVGLGEWVEYDLTSPVFVDGSNSLWVIWHANSTSGYDGGYPAGCTSHSSEYGDWWNGGNGWEHMSGITWTMKNYFNFGGGRSVCLVPIDLSQNTYIANSDNSSLSPIADETNSGYECINPKAIASTKNTTNYNRDVDHFRVFRTDCDSNEFSFIAETESQHFIDSSWLQLPIGSYKYGVSVVDGNGNESEIVITNCIDRNLYMYEITAAPNFDDRGMVVGTGEYALGDACTLTATPNEGHSFLRWMENGEEISTEAEYSFTVFGSRNLVAVFTVHVNDIIVFADPDTKYVCVNNWDTDGDGELTYDEAAAVTDLWGFYDNYDINSFDELQYFTGLSYIGDWTFEYCYYLSSIIIPNTVTSIGSYAFQHCGSLSSIILPNSLTSIGDGAFLECYSLNSIAFPESLVSIGNEAFHNCNGLRGELTLPESIDWVGEYAFANCDEITTINFNAVNCYVMGNSQHPVFYDCLSVEHIHIGENVESIPNYAFKRCSNVADIHVDAMTPPTVGISSFATISHSVPVYVPCGTSEDYQTASGWNEFMHILEDCSQMQTQTIALTAGWNWFSTYIEADDLLQQLEASLGENGLYIESSELLSTEYLDGEWLGDLEEVGITNEQMYLIQTSAACTIQLQGLKAHPANHVITINPEWNWVGYLCSEEMTIAEALAGFVPEDGDQIESMEGYAEYLDGEWLGLETLKPGQGFLYYSNSATTKTFVFPASAK